MKKIVLGLTSWGMQSLGALPPDLCIHLTVNVNIVDNRSQTEDTSCEENSGCCSDSCSECASHIEKEHYENKKSKS